MYTSKSTCNLFANEHELEPMDYDEFFAKYLPKSDKDNMSVVSGTSDRLTGSQYNSFPKPVYRTEKYEDSLPDLIYMESDDDGSQYDEWSGSDRGLDRDEESDEDGSQYDELEETELEPEKYQMVVPPGFNYIKAQFDMDNSLTPIMKQVLEFYEKDKRDALARVGRELLFGFYTRGPGGEINTPQKKVRAEWYMVIKKYSEYIEIQERATAIRDLWIENGDIYSYEYLLELADEMYDAVWDILDLINVAHNRT